MRDIPKPVSLVKEKPVRCALYYCSNLDGGGTADRNAIRVQRKTVDRYLAYRRDEGWTYASIQDYEDIGQQGGPMKRPAMRRLLADAEAGKLNCVVLHNFDCVTLSISYRVRLIRQFYRYGMEINETDVLPQHLNDAIWGYLHYGFTCTPEEFVLHQQLQRQHPIRCGIYVRGSRGGAHGDNVLRQRQAIVQFLAIWRLHNAQHVETAYQDIDLPESGCPQPALKKLLADVDANRIDCLIVNTFDRLTEKLISHEALLEKLRQRDVTFLTLRPKFYHTWGRRMERAWIGDMPRFLRGQKDAEKQSQAQQIEAAAG